MPRCASTVMHSVSKYCTKRKCPAVALRWFFWLRGDHTAQVELTYNWDPEVLAGGRNFGHLAYAVDDIYAACERLQSHGVTILRPPRDGYMAFVRSPDNISIELLQRGQPLAPAEPWLSMANTGQW